VRIPRWPNFRAGRPRTSGIEHRSLTALENNRLHGRLEAIRCGPANAVGRPPRCRAPPSWLMSNLCQFHARFDGALARQKTEVRPFGNRQLVPTYAGADCICSLRRFEEISPSGTLNPV
jgi:hypothetical protein